MGGHVWISGPPHTTPVSPTSLGQATLRLPSDASRLILSLTTPNARCLRLAAAAAALAVQFLRSGK